MQQLEHVEPGRLEWREVREPKLAGSLEALVRPIAVARCDLDTLMYSGGAPSVTPTPCAFGHRRLNGATNMTSLNLQNTIVSVALTASVICLVAACSSDHALVVSDIGNDRVAAALGHRDTEPKPRQ